MRKLKHIEIVYQEINMNNLFDDPWIIDSVFVDSYSLKVAEFKFTEQYPNRNIIEIREVKNENKK